MRHNPRPQEIYRHFKGNLYQILCLARHSETGEAMVVYQAMYGGFEIYTRPLAMFMEEVDAVKYPSAGQKYRFELRPGAVEGVVNAEREADVKQPSDSASLIKTPVSPEPIPTPQIQAGEEQEAEQINIDPLVLAFLDANSYGQRLGILDLLHNRITDDMINTMAVSVDLEIKEGDLEDRYTELRSCLRTFEKYECNRLR